MEGFLVLICQTVVFILAILSLVWLIGLEETFTCLTTHCRLLVLWDLSPEIYAVEGFSLFVGLFFNSCSDFLKNASELSKIFLWDEVWPRPGGVEWRLCSSSSLPLLGPFRTISVKQLNTFPAILAMPFSPSFIFTQPRVSSSVRIMRVNTSCGVLHINFYTGLNLHLSFFFLLQIVRKCLDMDCEQFPSCYFKRAYYSCNEQA